MRKKEEEGIFFMDIGANFGFGQWGVFLVLRSHTNPLHAQKRQHITLIQLIGCGFWVLSTW